MPQQVLLNIDVLDDPILGDGTPSFAGGVVSNEQANLLAENESSLMVNCDLSRVGKVSTRKGTIQLGDVTIGEGFIIQGMAYYWSGSFSYLVVACGGKLYRQAGAGWVQIATGGVQDNDTIDVVKTGRINKPGGYNVGETVLLVDGFTGPVIAGDIFVLWQRDKSFEYTITAVSPAFPATTTEITIGNPGLVVHAYDNDEIKIKRLGARVNNAGGYAGGVTTIAIDGITGALANGDKFLVNGEEIVHTITAHTETGNDTTGVTFTPALQAEYEASSVTVPIIFALGANKLFWTDGVGDIYSWDGRHTGNLSNSNPYEENSPAPTAVKWIVWFQNRLVAAGPAVDPEAIWFSDFGNASIWDENFQQLEVGGGESDPIVAVVPWMDFNLVVFKEHSIYVVNMDPSQNPIPEDSTLLVASYGVKLISHYVGIGSGRSIAQVGGPGGDIFFLGSDKQVHSLRRTIAAESQQEIGEVVSLARQDVFSQITTNFIQNSVAYYWNNRYILAIPIRGDEYAHHVQVYDTSLGRWAGTWLGWVPTAFCAKLLGDGQQALTIGQAAPKVLQWLEDTGADETDPETYQDAGVDIPTAILTRAYTLGDLYNWKTGLNVEFEFLDSLAFVNVTAKLDQSTAAGDVGNFSTITFEPLVLPFTLPAVLPAATFRRIQKDLQHFGQWRELQLYIRSESARLVLRSLKITGYMDTLQLQTLADTPIRAMCSDTGGEPEPEPVPPGPVMYYRELIIDHTKVPSDQTDFPVLVSLTDPTFKTVANGGHVQNANGYDMRPFWDFEFMDPLDYELESYDATTGTLLMWVKIPAVSSTVNTVFYLQYGNPDYTTNESTSDTWDESYISVQHLGDGTTLSRTDSKSAFFTLNLGTAGADTGQILGAASFEAASSNYLEPSNGIGPSAITVSGWLKAASLPGAYNAMFGQGFGSSTFALVDVKSNGKLRLRVTTTSVLGYDGTGVHTLSTDTWYYVVLTYDPVEGLAGYVNGVVDDTVAPGGILNTTTSAWYVGGHRLAPPEAFWDGLIDEVRISYVARSADWIMTEFNSQGDPATFIYMGVEIEIPLP